MWRRAFGEGRLRTVPSREHQKCSATSLCVCVNLLCHSLGHEEWWLEAAGQRRSANTCPTKCWNTKLYTNMVMLPEEHAGLYRFSPSLPSCLPIPDTTDGTAICAYIDSCSTTPGRFSAVRTGSPIGRVWVERPASSSTPVTTCHFGSSRQRPNIRELGEPCGSVRCEATGAHP